MVHDHYLISISRKMQNVFLPILCYSIVVVVVVAQCPWILVSIDEQNETITIAEPIGLYFASFAE